jgi:hypothetical protein
MAPDLIDTDPSPTSWPRDSPNTWLSFPSAKPPVTPLPNTRHIAPLAAGPRRGNQPCPRRHFRMPIVPALPPRSTTRRAGTPATPTCAKRTPATRVIPEVHPNHPHHPSNAGLRLPAPLATGRRDQKARIPIWGIRGVAVSQGIRGKSPSRSGKARSVADQESANGGGNLLLIPLMTP